MYVGEGEAIVRETFQRARLSAPAIILLDEVDSIAGAEDSLTEAIVAHANMPCILHIAALGLVFHQPETALANFCSQHRLCFNFLCFCLI